ncbi:hypothetical protein GF325_08855 [Candidatus Bathyarchaeota archaeon]|nr:hypothetical protein [Candidatus Bathyarchaeota archaeon]
MVEEIEVFKLHETGEYSTVEGVTKEDIEEIFDEREVFIILIPDLRRLYIWKGKACPVQKKFISSRVAQKIQRDRVKNAGMQHKIVSIDQGDELDEFIKNLGLKHVKTQAEREAERKKKEEEEARRFEELMKKPDIVKEEPKEEEAIKASSYVTNLMKKAKTAFGPVVSTGQSRDRVGMSGKQKQEILDNMLKQEVPDGFSREHLILDGELYVNMKKKGKVFDKEVEIETWDAFDGALEDGFMDIDPRKLRFFIKEGKILAVEIFKISKETKDGKPGTGSIESAENA